MLAGKNSVRKLGGFIKRKVQGIALIVLIGITCFNLCAFVLSPFSQISKNYSGDSEEDIIKKLANTPIDEVIGEMEVISENTKDMNAMGYHAIALLERLDELSWDKIFKMIEDPSYSTDVRITMVDLAGYKDRKSPMKAPDYSRLKSYVFDENLPVKVRISVILNLPTSDETNLVLKEAALTAKDEEIAFQALRRLNISSESPEIAREIAKKFIEDDVQGKRLLAVLMVEAKRLRKTAAQVSAGEQKSFIALCSGVINDKDSDEAAIDTAAYALGAARCREAMWFVLDSEKIDDEVKWMCIEENYMVFTDIMKGSPSPSDIDYIVRAANICPVDAIVDGVRAYLSAHPDAKVQTRLTVTETVPAIEKYLEY